MAAPPRASSDLRRALPQQSSLFKQHDLEAAVASGRSELQDWLLQTRPSSTKSPGGSPINAADRLAAAAALGKAPSASGGGGGGGKPRGSAPAPSRRPGRVGSKLQQHGLSNVGSVGFGTAAAPVAVRVQ